MKIKKKKIFALLFGAASLWGLSGAVSFVHALEATNSSAYLVIGQQNMTSNSVNQGGSAGSNTLSGPAMALIVGNKMIISDTGNNRILIYNSVPTSSNAGADVVIGQTNMSNNTANQGGRSRQIR